MSAPAGKKIAVLDFGGQYAHLIASRVRRLGAYTEIVSPADLDRDTARREYAGLIYSGGPASVYEPGAPHSRPELLECEVPILGICYGHQLIMLQAGGAVEAAEGREYGPARLKLSAGVGVFAGEDLERHPVVWMSHGDEVARLPAGFSAVASTEDCRYAAVADPERRIYGIQFHPEVKDSERGDEYLKNFIAICGLSGSWNLDDFLEAETARIRAQVGDSKVFLLISGGVDSTVAFALLARCLPHDHLLGLFVDTGFMRENEGVEVERALRELGVRLITADASDQYFARLAGVYDPEEKRKRIGELFLEVQAQETAKLGLNDADWRLGQGTIYPDTIESGATKHSHRIKTHHNRVPAIEALIAAGKVVEPLRDLYKDEVRRLGRLLGLPSEIVERHPFPGPGLAVRLLCLEKPLADTPDSVAMQNALERGEIAGDADAARIQDALARAHLGFRVLPLLSVGVQGDQRSYARCGALFAEDLTRIDWDFYFDIARRIPNRYRLLNRTLLNVARKSSGPLAALEIVARTPVDLSPARTALLRRADHIVHTFQREAGIYDEIWQFPTVLAPAGLAGSDGESIILRPIISIDAMTASVYRMRPEQLNELAPRLLALDGVDLVFYDLTSKPPGTIEWE